MAGDDLELHDVAVVVFARAPGVDRIDAAHRVQAAVRRAVCPVAGAKLEDAGPRGSGASMPVLGVMEVSAAVRNGYLWVVPTKRDVADRGLSED